MAHIHILQHVHYETPSVIEHYFKKNGLAIGFTHFYENELPPSHLDFNWLIIMGGPMSVCDENRFPWLKDEKVFIKEAIQTGKIVLGICLGAQLIAAALDAPVYKNKHPEIGWFPVYRPHEAENNALGRLFPRKIEGFHFLLVLLRYL